MKKVLFTLLLAMATFAANATTPDEIFTFLLQSSSSSTEIELTFLAISFASLSTSFLPHASPAFINSFGRWVYEALAFA